MRDRERLAKQSEWMGAKGTKKIKAKEADDKAKADKEKERKKRKNEKMNSLKLGI